MAKILVTGGSGFIGSHLVEKCIYQGHSVRVIDNLAVGRAQNLISLKDCNTVELIQADISDYQTISPLFKNIDWVFHLAARADIVPSVQNPMIYHQSNVDGTIHVLEAARKHKVKRFIYAASSSCYGIAQSYPTPETASINPEYPYALTKYLGEQYVLHWAKVYGLSALSLRFFNVFGPRARTSGTYGAVFGVFLTQKLNNVPYTVVGDGTQTRDFTYVSDVVDALYLAAQSSISGEIFNVGSGGTYSVNSLVEILGGPVTYIPKRPGEPDSTYADICKISKQLGWRPKISFVEGVNRLLADLECWREAPLWSPESIAKATEDWFKYLSK